MCVCVRVPGEASSASACGCGFGQGATPEKHPSRGKRRRGERARCSVWTKPSVRPAAQGAGDQEGGVEAARPWGPGRPLEGRGCRPRPDRECRRGRAGGFCLRDPTGCSCWERTQGSRPWDEEAHLLDFYRPGRKGWCAPGAGRAPDRSLRDAASGERCVACSCKQAVKRDRLGCGLENLFQYSQ